MLQDAHVREELEKKQATVVTDNKKNMLAEGAGAQLVLVATLPTPWIWLHRRWRLKSLNKRKEDSDEQLTFALNAHLGTETVLLDRRQLVDRPVVF